MIKHRLLIAAVVLAGVLVPVAANAGIRIELGDRGFYHGATYYDNDWEMLWMPGHWGQHRHHKIHNNMRDDRHDERRDDRRSDEERR